MSHLSQAKYQSLTRRRGSASAHDPLALHSIRHGFGERQAISRLTIVRVASDDAATSLYSYGGAGDSSPDSSPRSARSSLTPPHSPLMRSSTGSRRHGGSAGGSPRLSFASSSFAQEPGSASPPRSPKELRRRHSGSGLHPHRAFALTPQQLVDLAQTSVRPPPAPKLQRHPSAPALLGARRDLAGPALTTTLSPARFIPVPDSQFLPFIDRAGEVTTFISTPPTSRLMALLEQAFPIHLRIRTSRSRPPPYSLSRVQSFADELAAALQAHALEPQPVFDDPVEWSYATLLEWMCTVPREIADDAEWVRRLRACVMAHSEQIAVALLSALGVPMEGVDELVYPVPHDDTAVASPTAVRPESATPTPMRDHPHRSVITTPPTVLEDAAHEDDDAFQLSISAILPMPEPEELPLPLHPHSNASSRPPLGGMEAIGESEDEEEGELEIRRGREPRSGTATARAGSPAAAPGIVRGARVIAPDSSDTESDATTDTDDEHDERERFPDFFGITFATVPRDTGEAVLPSPRPVSALPVPVTTSKPPKGPGAGSARVAHVLSGAPGHAGYTWRPGGPLFARSFGGDGSASEDEVPPIPSKAVFDIKRPSLRHRSRSHDARKASVLAVPPNTPTGGLTELPDVDLIQFDTLASA